MPALTLSLLGSPRIERDGAVVTVDTRKATALIAYLAVTGQRHSRDSLATLLWPENGQTGARAALRRTLSTLNKALDGAWLEVDRESLALAPTDNLHIDVNRFRGLLLECRRHGHPETDVCPACVAPLTEAVALYRDDFLAGFSLRDSSSFDDWQFFQAENLRHELAAALERLVRCHMNQGEWEAAIGYARRWLALDPLHEPAHRELIRLYAWAGQRAAAVHQYRECVRVLEQELGVPPLEATNQLYQAIKENQMPAPPRPWTTGSADLPREAVAPAAIMEVAPAADHIKAAPHTADYPLVGRAAEWERLIAAYTATNPTGRVVVLEGEAGIGKTRLAEALVDHARAAGAPTLVARCYEGETNLAYAPFSQALHVAIGMPDHTRWLHALPASTLSEAARLLPDLSHLRPGLPPAAPLDSPGAQIHFFESISRVVLAACGAVPPGILLVDDLHWADAASLDLLIYLLRRLREQPLFVLLTWRTEEMPTHARLRALLAELERGGVATRVRLGRLSQAAVAELVRSTAVGRSDSPENLGGRLFSETEGLPFFIVEYLDALTKGAQPLDPAQWTLPGGVRDLLHSRLKDVSETGWQLLNTAAVIGRSFDFETLREASGRAEEETVAALEELIAQGVVEEVGAPGEQALVYDFSHEKLRTLVYDETSLARRRLLHRRVAEALVGRARGHREAGALAAQIAFHFRLAGQEMVAADYFYHAGEHARALYANAEALAHFRSALALGHPNTAVLHEAIGDVQTLLGNYGEAVTSYETAAALSTADAVAALDHKLGNLHHRRGDWELAQSHFEAALAAFGAEGRHGERARIYADWSLTAHMRRGNGHPGAMAVDPAPLAQTALDLAESAGDTRALAQVHNILGVLASNARNLQQAQLHLERSLDLADALNDPGVRVAALNNLALAYGANGALDEALQLGETALALCSAQGDRHREAALHNNLADLLHAAGRSEDAMLHLTQAVSIYAEIGIEAGDVQPEIWKLAEW